MEITKDNFGEQFTLLKTRVYGWCLGMTTNKEDAEDAVQETFIQAYKCIDQFKGESSFITWLCAIAKNTVYMQFRRTCTTSISKKQREFVYIDDPDVHLELVHKDMELEGTVDRLTLDKLIADLSPRKQQIFVMHEIEGFTHTEIANQLGKTSGYTKGDLSRARRKLRTLLKRKYVSRYGQLSSAKFKYTANVIRSGDSIGLYAGLCKETQSASQDQLLHNQA